MISFSIFASATILPQRSFGRVHGSRVITYNQQTNCRSTGERGNSQPWFVARQ